MTTESPYGSVERYADNIRGSATNQREVYVVTNTIVALIANGDVAFGATDAERLQRIRNCLAAGQLVLDQMDNQNSQQLIERATTRKD